MKKTKYRIRAASAIMWRVTAIVLVLWLCAMTYLTVTCARTLRNSWAERSELVSQWYSDKYFNDSYMLIYAMEEYDRYVYGTLDLPFDGGDYFNFQFDQTSVTYFDEEDNVALGQGYYLYFYYEDRAEMEGSAEESIPEPCYVNLEGTGLDILMDNYVESWSYSGFLYDGTYRFTGYFEGNEFIALEISRCDDEYRHEKALQDWKWSAWISTSVEEDRETVDIYTDFIKVFDATTDQVVVDGVTYENHEALAKADIEKPFDGYIVGDSLIETVIMHYGYQDDADKLGFSGTYTMITSCRPLDAAVANLWAVYLVSLIGVSLALLLLWLTLRRHLTKPLQQVLQQGKKDLALLQETYESNWQEPYELEQVYVALQQQVHELQNEKQQLQMALDYARDAEEKRRQMVSNITHELKTPLAIIHSYTEGLSANIAEEKRDQYLSIILEETERMDEMVLEMLDLSRLEAGKVRLATDRFSLLELTQSIFAKLELAVEAKELKVHYNLADSFEIVADEARIGQVITNFATNAIKYTPNGGNIWIEIFQRWGVIYFSIENEGEHLPEEDLEHLWDSFYRADASRTTKGTGLGLAIAKAIVQLHRGECSVQNTTNGLKFQFRL